MTARNGKPIIFGPELFKKIDWEREEGIKGTVRVIKKNDKGEIILDEEVNVKYKIESPNMYTVTYEKPITCYAGESLGWFNFKPNNINAYKAYLKKYGV